MKKHLLTKTTCMIMVLFMLFGMIPVNATSADDSLNTSDSVSENYDESNSPLLRWRNTDHKNKLCEYVIDQLKLTQTQGNWIKETCSAADDKYSDVAMLHDKKGCNYIAGLNAIYMFARMVNSTNKLSKILSSMPNISESDKTKVTILCDTLQKYLDDKGSISKEHKQYLIYGFGLHMIEDLYAHRIQVKTACLTDWGKTDTSSTKYFQTRDFIPSKLNEFKQNIKEGTIYTSDIKRWMYDDGRTFKINYEISGKKTTTRPGNVYIDNPTFMPRRFAAAKKASVSFMTYVRKSDSSFSDIVFYRGTYNLTIYKFSEYKKAAGIN